MYKSIEIYAHSKFYDIVSQEIDLFVSGDSRGTHLQMIYDYLQTVSPTSVDSERCFSSAGYTCNKLRSSLTDQTLDALIFLRYYLKK